MQSTMHAFTAPDVYAAVNTIGVVALYDRENIFRTSVGVCRAERGAGTKGGPHPLRASSKVAVH
jgi:hypothetical protein